MLAKESVMQALVLGGGSIKGAFQAGAIAEVLGNGFVPDIITGVSAGSLNGAFLADRVGQARAKGRSPDWRAIGEELVKFWGDKVKRPSDIIRKRTSLSVLLGLILKKFNGLTDNAPLKRILKADIDERNIKSSQVLYSTSSVNLASGESITATRDFPDLLKYILASSAIPVIMPIEWIGGKPLVDGGTRNVMPFGQAIDLGATKIMNILCHAENLPAIAPNFKDPLKLMDRLFAVITNEIINNDMYWVRYINQVLEPRGIPSPRGKTYRKVELRIIRPPEEPDISMDSFNKQGIANLLECGRNIARGVLAQPPL